MKYHKHKITLHRTRRMKLHYALIHGPIFTGETFTLDGGRFANLLYACRIIRKREAAQ